MLSRWLPLSGFVTLWAVVGCGDSSTGGNGGGGGTNLDFTLSLSENSVTLTAGQSVGISATVTAINGFSSNVVLQVSGLPLGVAVSPANATVVPGNSQQLTFTAAASVSETSANLTVKGTSGSLNHSQNVALTIKTQVSTSEGRTRYVRTDAATSYLGILNNSWIVFDPNNNYFYFSDPGRSRITVMNTETEAIVGNIPVPGAQGLDFTPDYSTLYAGTEIGDVYAINPATISVTHRYVASQIGTYGFEAAEVRVLATGSLALLGTPGQPGESFASDGYPGVAIWNPATNDIAYYGTSTALGYFSHPVNTICDAVGDNLAELLLVGGRSRVILGTASGGWICMLDPATGDSIVALGGGDLELHLVATPDGTEIISPGGIGGGNDVTVFDATTLAVKSSFPVLGDVSSAASLMVSPDSKTLYMNDANGIIYAYTIATGALAGWLPNLEVGPLVGGFSVGATDSPCLGAMDNTGLMAGPMEEGIGFIDTTLLKSGTAGTPFLNSYLNPATGPAEGGTATEWVGDFNGTVDSVYFGPNPATDISASSGSFHATAPAGPLGPVDIYTHVADGGVQIVPEGYSYGPTIVEVTPNLATAEGGGTGIVYGYGFGSTISNSPELQVTIGGQQVGITAYSDNAYGSIDPPFPLEALEYTIPRGTAGTSADVGVTTPSGTTTLSGGLQYLPATQQYFLPGAQLVQGIFDAKRDLYYFTDTSAIRVFSRSAKTWQTSFSVSAAPAGTTHRLWGIALSPNGSQLAVSDLKGGVIYVIDPDNATDVRTFNLPVSGSEITMPAGLAVSDSGMIYFGVDSYGGSSDAGFFKLDTTSGAVTPYNNINEPGTNDYLLRAAITSDNANVYFNQDGVVYRVDTATDAVSLGLVGVGCCYGNDDLNLALSQTNLIATGYLYDVDLNAESALTLNDREALNTTYVYGEKFSPDGKLMFQPSVNGVDVYDGRLGTLLDRISLPIALSQNFDALVTDSTDNLLVAITGQYGDGIALIDLTSLTEPGPLDYRATAKQGQFPIHARGGRWGRKIESAAEASRWGDIPYAVTVPSGEP